MRKDRKKHTPLENYDAMNTPKTKEAIETFNEFCDTPVAAEEMAKLERENARLRESFEHIRDNGMTMTKEAIVAEASRSLSA